MGASGELLTRTFVAGAARFAVRCNNADVRDVVESLFIDLASTPRTADRIVDLAELADGKWSFRVDESDEHVPRSPGAALTSLVSAVTRLALDAEPDRLHLHAAALARDGRGVLMSAPSGTGKTTLSAALAQHGWSYTSDEAVALDPGDTECHGFPKPLVIKPGGTGVLSELGEIRVRVGPSIEEWWHVPASRIPAPIADSIHPVVIAVLSGPANGSYGDPSSVRKLHPADAVVKLLEQAMDPERFGGETVTLLAELAAGAQCVQIQVGSLESSVAILEELVGGDVAREPVQAVAVQSPTDRWAVAEHVRSVLIGERAVVHDTHGGAIAALDEAGSAVWRALHGDAPEWWPMENLRATSTVGFLEQLVAHGLLTDTGRTGGS